METVKLADLDKGPWKVSGKDRPHIQEVKAKRAQAGAMDGITKAMAANVKIMEILAEKMDIRSEPMGQPAINPPAVNVTVQADTTKKKFRCTPVRDETGLMLYVDIEQL
jgi:hypothetical protein